MGSVYLNTNKTTASNTITNSSAATVNMSLNLLP